MIEPFDDPTDEDLSRFERTIAPRAFNEAWRLLDTGDRNADQDDELLAAALTQRFLWYRVGTPRNRAIADWQVSRVASVLGLADLARRFAHNSLRIAIDEELGPFVAGYAYEALARSAALIDDRNAVMTHLEAARAQLDEVSDPEERELLAADLDALAPAQPAAHL